MNKRRRYGEYLLLFMFFTFLSSCAGEPANPQNGLMDNPVHNQLGMEKVGPEELPSYNTEGLNPYIPYKSLLNEKDRSVFYVYKIDVPPAQALAFELVSATLRDENGAEAASFLTIDGVRGYWAGYGLTSDYAQQVQSKIDQTYLGKTKFQYSSRKGRSYIILFKGKEPQINKVKAKLEILVDGREFSIEVD
jgi:hypothetical protein